MKINPLYIIPNLFTAASAFLGVSSIIYAINGRIEFACWLVIISMILDGLDGRVARITNTASKFGVEFDSLCDLVAFGCAPAILIYVAFGHNYGRFGLVVSCLFVVFGAIRLARFNIITGNESSHFFIGLPIPSAAIFVVTMLILEKRYNVFATHNFWLLIFTFIVGILMVSNIRYPNFKHIRWNLFKMIILIVLLSVLFIHPIEGIFSGISAYIVYGILRYVYVIIAKVLLRRKIKHKKETK